jgi:hypothetical protein
MLLTRKVVHSFIPRGRNPNSVTEEEVQEINDFLRSLKNLPLEARPDPRDIINMMKDNSEAIAGFRTSLTDYFKGNLYVYFTEYADIPYIEAFQYTFPERLKTITNLTMAAKAYKRGRLVRTIIESAYGPLSKQFAPKRIHAAERLFQMGMGLTEDADSISPKVKSDSLDKFLTQTGKIADLAPKVEVNINTEDDSKKRETEHMLQVQNELVEMVKLQKQAIKEGVSLKQLGSFKVPEYTDVEVITDDSK